MSWEKLIISPKSSQQVKEDISNLNKYDNFDGKYIGVIPIFWDSLGIHNKNNMMGKHNHNLDQQMQNLRIENDETVPNVYTSRSYFLVSREFYYLENNNDPLESYYPVFRFPNQLNFTMREIKNQIYICLNNQGFKINDFDLFRIYKMNGFHLFAIILPKKIDVDGLKEGWSSNYSLELLPLTNKEIINPFMKISYNKFLLEQNNNKSYKTWNQSIQGYLIDSKKDNKLNNKTNIIHFKIKWSEFLATLANLIDSESDENKHLYFKCNIFDSSQLNTNLFSKAYQEKMDNKQKKIENESSSEMVF